MKQHELAEKIGVTEVTVSNWTRGKHQLKLVHAVKVASVLGESLDIVAAMEPRVLKQAIKSAAL